MKARILIGVLAIAAVGTSVIVLVARSPHTPQRRALSYAREACARAKTFEQLVEKNAPATTATDELARALAAARAAEALDTRWIPLESGVRTVQLALEHDDAGAANVGIRVVTSNCKDIR